MRAKHCRDRQAEPVIISVWAYTPCLNLLGALAECVGGGGGGAGVNGAGAAGHLLIAGVALAAGRSGF